MEIFVKIYALCDFGLLKSCDLSFENYIKICKNHNVCIIQYRDKINKKEQIKKNLLKLRNLWDKTLIINDSLELVKFCDGIHLGQDDLVKISTDKKDAIEKIRKKIKDKIIGISTHNIVEIKETNELNIDYIGLGAYRTTSTKNNAIVLGKNISEVAKYSNKKVAVIGGVLLDDKIENVEYLVIGRGLIES
jgi:thiamine-phosphate pyrophosphorylase